MPKAYSISYILSDFLGKNISYFFHYKLPMQHCRTYNGSFGSHFFKSANALLYPAPSVRPSVCLSVHLSVLQSVLSVCPSVHPSVHLSVSLSVRHKTFSFFPIYSQTVNSNKTFLLYKVVCILILHIVRAWHIESYLVASTTESTI